MTIHLEQISFHGDLLWAGRDGARELVALKPISDSLHLSWPGQLQRIRRDAILNEKTVMVKMDTPGGPQDMICMERGYINGWLFGIDDRRIGDEGVREKILTYKRECHEVLHQHFDPQGHVHHDQFSKHDTHTFTPDEDDIGPLGTQQWLSEIALVRECRRIHGIPAARAMWPKLGLPMVPEMNAEATLVLSGGAAEDVTAFLAERCLDIPGHRSRTLDLWAAYTAWCKAAGREPCSINIFGRTLKQRYRKVKASVSWYVGVAIRENN